MRAPEPGFLSHILESESTSIPVEDSKLLVVEYRAARCFYTAVIAKLDRVLCKKHVLAYIYIEPAVVVEVCESGGGMPIRRGSAFQTRTPRHVFESEASQILVQARDAIAG